MSIALEWLAMVLVGLAGTPEPKADGPEIIYQFQVIEVHGLQWREAAGRGLEPVTSRGGVTVWTAPRDFFKTLPAGTTKEVVTTPRVSAFAQAPAHFTIRNNHPFVTQVAWRGEGAAAPADDRDRPRRDDLDHRRPRHRPGSSGSARDRRYRYSLGSHAQCSRPGNRLRVKRQGQAGGMPGDCLDHRRHTQFCCCGCERNQDGDRRGSNHRLRSASLVQRRLRSASFDQQDYRPGHRLHPARKERGGLRDDMPDSGPCESRGSGNQEGGIACRRRRSLLYR